MPDNVTITALTQRGLRDLLDEADAVIMPLEPSDFQAGITTILEAMSMERPIICTETDGQTDVVEDGVHGLYVAPGDMLAMRRAIQQLIDDPDCAVLMGKKGRELAQKQADVRLYADLFAESVRLHAGVATPTRRRRKGRRPPTTSMPSDPPFIPSGSNGIATHLERSAPHRRTG